MAIGAVLLAAMLAGPGGSAQAELFYEEIFSFWEMAEFK